LPVPKKWSPFGAATCDRTKGSVNVPSFFSDGPGRSSPREVTAKPSMSPARKSSALRTRQNCGATAKRLGTANNVTASATTRRMELFPFEVTRGVARGQSSVVREKRIMVFLRKPDHWPLTTLTTGFGH
jgi:hypothetical protein